MRIVICDDHDLLVAGLALALADLGHVIEAAVSTPAEAIQVIASQEPEALLVDLTFPQGSGLDLAQQVLEAHPNVKVVVLTGCEEPRLLAAALELGVSGFVLKGQPVGAIAAALEKVAAGELGVDPAVLLTLREDGPCGRPSPSSRTPLHALTPREHHVLRLLARGLSTAQMAASLGVTPSTVKTHVQSIFTKLQVHSRLQAVAMLNHVDPTVRWGDGVAVGD